MYRLVLSWDLPPTARIADLCAWLRQQETTRTPAPRCFLTVVGPVRRVMVEYEGEFLPALDQVADPQDYGEGLLPPPHLVVPGSHTCLLLRRLDAADAD